ncbi:MAG: flagellar protein [Lachnospiraceae bacterium]|jgi:flagellar operon protein|nr:flagellar protein [Lachnospiraceae bacterium]
MNEAANTFLSMDHVRNEYLHEAGENRAVNRKTEEGFTFGQMLAMKEASIDKGIVFSKHAKNRLDERKIDLTTDQLKRLEEGTEKAGKKGIRESLVLVDDLAFIVNIKNRTVVTAMDQMESKENIFTNIDGAVIN